MARAPLTASSRFFGVTSQVRYRQSKLWCWYAASIIATVGFSAAGCANRPVSWLRKFMVLLLIVCS